MPKGDKAKLKELYPNLETYLAAREEHATWKDFATAIGIKVTGLMEYRRYLTEGPKTTKERKPPEKLFTFQIDAKKINERIRDIGIDADVNKVSVYKITDAEAFTHAPFGSYDGLQLDRVERSKTWGEVTHWGTEGDAY